LVRVTKDFGWFFRVILLWLSSTSFSSICFERDFTAK
jgi:hypothetical protein